MSQLANNYIAEKMDEIKVPYAFQVWNENPVPDIYFVGTYNEISGMEKEESGLQETTFILRGFTRGSWELLEQAKHKIEKAMCETAILEDGSGIAVFYESGLIVPTGDYEIKSIQINLGVKEWKVN